MLIASFKFLGVLLLITSLLSPPTPNVSH
jgi:hypothetical protein